MKYPEWVFCFWKKPIITHHNKQHVENLQRKYKKSNQTYKNSFQTNFILLSDVGIKAKF